MKRSMALFLSSFIISLALIAGIWSFLKIDYAAKRIGFSNVSGSSTVAANTDLKLTLPVFQVLDFVVRNPQILPYPVRLGTWAAVALPDYVKNLI